jgi:hypothetical protein
MPLCNYCDTSTTFGCTGCESVYYCCLECQKLDWVEGSHNLLCYVSVPIDGEEYDLDEMLDAIDELFETDVDTELSIDRKKKRRKKRRKRRKKRRKGRLSRAKAGKILRHGRVRGKPLTKRQKRFFVRVSFSSNRDGLEAEGNHGNKCIKNFIKDPSH